MKTTEKTTFGIVGGIGPLACADLFFKFVRATPAADDSEHANVILEQLPFREPENRSERYTPSKRKLHIFNVIRKLVSQGCDRIILSCFISHTFIDELADACDVPILNMMTALKTHIRGQYPHVGKIGILTSDYVGKQGLFEDYFDDSELELLYPDPPVQEECLMEAIYGADGIKAGRLSGKVVENLENACMNLMDKGAEIIVPGFTEIPILVEVLHNRIQSNILDSNMIYAQSAFGNQMPPRKSRSPRIGIIGGLGPSATVDLMGKIIMSTPARNDQEHIRMVVEHNPAIPDRSAHLLNNEADPTLPLFSCARKLEERDADMIAVPCNTAHAFIDRIQPHLSIPIIHMIEETATRIAEDYPEIETVGLLATSGTVETGIYRRAFDKSPFSLITPDHDHQEMVMEAIYGDKGAKAGYTSGVAGDNLEKAASHLVERGASVLILGCTELPLIIEDSTEFSIAGKKVVILDPTRILAEKCVRLASGFE